MRKKLCLVALTGLLCTTASMANDELKGTNEENGTFRHKEEKVYVAIKGLTTSGDTIKEETSKLKGTNGVGVGIDLGYRTGTGINFEVDYSYTKLNLTESKPTEEDTKMTGDYHSFSFDALYAHHINKPLVVFAKTGVEYEIEKIDKLNVYKTNTGLLYGAGAEYEIKENMALIFEYEDSTIDGPKGYTLAAGLVIGLDMLK